VACPIRLAEPDVNVEDRDRGLADREGRRRNDWRQRPLEPFSRLGQLGRYLRAGRMDFGADMVSHQPHDAFALGGGQSLLRLGQAGRQPVDPESTIGVEHHFDDGRIFEPGSRWRARAPCAACVRPEKGPLPGRNPNAAGIDFYGALTFSAIAKRLGVSDFARVDNRNLQPLEPLPPGCPLTERSK